MRSRAGTLISSRLVPRLEALADPTWTTGAKGLLTLEIRGTHASRVATRLMRGSLLSSLALLAMMLASEELRGGFIDFLATSMAVLARRLKCIRAKLREATY
jgi:hypothetical protein